MGPVNKNGVPKKAEERSVTVVLGKKYTRPADQLSAVEMSCLKLCEKSLELQKTTRYWRNRAIMRTAKGFGGQAEREHM